MAKQYPPFQNEDAKKYMELIGKWKESVIFGLNTLVEDHDKVVRMDQFSGISLRILLFFLSGDVTVPKEIMEKYHSNHAAQTAIISASPQEDGGWRIWTVLEEKDDE